MKVQFTKSELNFLAESIKYCTVKDNIGLLESKQLVTILECDNLSIVKKYLKEEKVSNAGLSTIGKEAMRAKNAERNMKEMEKAKEYLHASKKEIAKFYKMAYEELWAYGQSLYYKMLGELNAKDADFKAIEKRYQKKAELAQGGAILKTVSDNSKRFKDRYDKLFNSGKESMKENKQKALSALKDLEFGEFFNHMKSLLSSIRNTIAQFLYIKLGYEKADRAALKRMMLDPKVEKQMQQAVSMREVINSEFSNKTADWTTNFNNATIMSANALIAAMAILSAVGIGVLGKMLFPVIRNLVAKIKQMFESGKKGKKPNASSIKSAVGVIKKVAEKSGKKHLKKRAEKASKNKK